MIYKRCECEKPSCGHYFEYTFKLRGIRYRRSTRTANKQAALRVEARRRAAIIEGRDEDEKPSITLKQHIKDYCEHTAKTNRTGHKDVAVLDRLLTAVGDQPLHHISAFHIEKWKHHRVESVSRATVNRELNIVRGCFGRGVEWGRLAVSPCATVRVYPVDDTRVRVLFDHELALVMGSNVRLLCQVTLECLPRLSEVLNIHRTHIGHGWIEVRRKGGSVERIACRPELSSELLARCHEQSGFAFGRGALGAIPSEQAASNMVVRELRRLGIMDASHHTMRHTGVTLMLERGVNPRVIQKLAGWSSLRMLERYGHARDAEMVRAVTGNAAYLEEVAHDRTGDAEGGSGAPENRVGEGAGAYQLLNPESATA